MILVDRILHCARIAPLGTYEVAGNTPECTVIRHIDEFVGSYTVPKIIGDLDEFRRPAGPGILAALNVTNLNCARNELGGRDFPQLLIVDVK